MCSRELLIRRGRQATVCFVLALIALSSGLGTLVKAWQTAKPADSPETMRIKQALDAPVDFAIEPQAFQDAMHTIATHYRIRIRLDRKGLAAAGIDTAVEVQMGKSGKPLRRVLAALASQFPKPVEFQVRDGELVVTPKPRVKDPAPAK